MGTSHPAGEDGGVGSAGTTVELIAPQGGTRPPDGLVGKSQRPTRPEAAFHLGFRNISGSKTGHPAFTLVEVAMAVIVLALTLTTALTAMQQVFLEFDTARNLEVAGNILQCEIEKERLLPWAQASDAAYLPVIDPSFARNQAIAGRFTLSRTLTVLAGHSGQVVQITLTVNWRSHTGRPLARSYTTYYTQGGLYEYLYNNP